uniref:HD transcription factor n=1 Tax=Gnetum gnemon TaxID=3382 RepID=S6CSA8_GNEGN|nr:HD transcription factor [Gnetum gnemon]
MPRIGRRNGNASSNSDGGGDVKKGSSRWTPTPEQRQILEKIFRSQYTIKPTHEQIEFIARKLQVYGPIEPKNVFFWFQNHKARNSGHSPKHDHQDEAASSASESQVVHNTVLSSMQVPNSFPFSHPDPGNGIPGQIKYPFVPFLFSHSQTQFYRPYQNPKIGSSTNGIKSYITPSQHMMRQFHLHYDNIENAKKNNQEITTRELNTLDLFPLHPDGTSKDKKS